MFIFLVGVNICNFLLRERERVSGGWGLLSIWKILKREGGERSEKS